ncbi:pectinesterase [Clostridium tarantellae]|uniref:Pectinesterase n=1 Tax=Clostridium tarantellae TaxID=39493 RepID=A0A6I1MH62_9CLOT|nr:pectinesterase [Clostridium tarantellae]MPQ42715.1 pectinesterase [Clostridium tarantellae]
MNSLDKEIINFIKKASIRVRTNLFLKNFIVGLIVSLCLCLFIIITSIFIAFQNWIELCVMMIILSVITSIIVSIIKAPKTKEIALIVDNKGLKERITTYLELSNKNDDISIAQKDDTLKHIKNYNLKINLPIKFHKRGLYIIAILTALCMVGAVVPSKSRNEAKHLRKFEKYKAEMVKKIEKEKKKLLENKQLTEEEKKALDEHLKKAIKELQIAKNKKEKEKAIEKLEKKLDNLKKDIKNEKGKEELDKLKNNLIKDFKDKKIKENKEDKNKLITELNKVKEGKDLAKAIEEGNKENTLEQLKKLNKSLEKMTEAEKSKLASSLKNTNLNDPDLQKALNNAGDSVMNGEINEDELAGALQSLSSSENKNGDKNNSNSSKNNENSLSGSSSENSNGSGNGGNGNGNSNGNGDGTGKGWNTGNKYGNEKDFEEGKKEDVFIPGRGEGKDNNLTGNKNGEGNSQMIETENGLNKKGEKVNYESVLGDYSNKAMESLNNSNLPEAMKNAVKEYFNGLE